MTARERRLTECIQVRTRFLRSIHLERDYAARSDGDDYILSATACDVVRRIGEGLSDESTYRAFTVTGPYGAGKSAFAVFLTRLLCDAGQAGVASWRQLENVQPRLAADLKARIESTGSSPNTRLLPILITGRRAPAALCLAEGVLAGLSRFKGREAERQRDAVTRFISDIRSGGNSDSRQLTGFLEDLAARARHCGYAGVLVLIDEMGKLFEFAARAPHRGDVFAVQEIAEQASRSGRFPLLFVGFLHQGFEDYGQHLDSLTRREWAKIHGRFEDVRFLEPVEQVMRMVRRAVQWAEPPSGELRKRLQQVARECAKSGIAPAGMSKAEFEELSVACYPLHPTTLVALPVIFRRFAQNERSLFSYLSSLEPGGFQEFLAENILSSEPVFVRLDRLFDHFTMNFGAGLFRQPHARRWMEAADVLERKEALQPLHIQVVKAIGVLGALSDLCHLRSGEQMISAALDDSSKPTARIRRTLQDLRERSILTYRAYNDTYRIWEGSDVDIDDRVDEGRRKVRGAIRLAVDLEKYLEKRPIVARRHSFETGTLRYFQPVYVDDPARVADAAPTPAGAAGQILVCLGADESQILAFREMALANSIATDVVVAIPQESRELLAALTELAAMRWAWDETQALRDDRVARRELAIRVTEAECSLQRNLSLLLDPRPEPLGSGCQWFWRGEQRPVVSRVDASQLLSVVADTVYHKAPRIRNELIVRRSLSAAAAAARRDLIERMLTSAEVPMLGISGFPPERSMYESVLRATGLHVEVSPGIWAFAQPDSRDVDRLRPVWGRLHALVFDRHGDPQPVSDLFTGLSEPPYGAPEGLHPVLLCAFMQVYRNEVTLYREGTFVPEPGAADFEVLMRRPELFALAGSRMSGARARVAQRIAVGLRVAPATVPVVRALFKMVRSLPEVAWRTKHLKEQTQRVRHAFDKARSPERFLYVDLPLALGLSVLAEDGRSPDEVQQFFDRLNESLEDWSTIAARVSHEARQTFLTACGSSPSDAGWRTLRNLATRLGPRERDPYIRQVLERIAESGADGSDSSSVLAFVSGRPVTNWLDEDIERFPHLAEAAGEVIRRAVALNDEETGNESALRTLSEDQRQAAQLIASDLAKSIAALEPRCDPPTLRAALLLLADSVTGG